MKTTGCRVWAGFILLTSLHARAQVSTGSLRTPTETNQLTDAQLAGRAAQWRVKQRGAHETEWYTVRYRTNAGTGKVTASTNSYIELATGLNRFESTTGKWVESKEEIEIVPGGAVARKGQHRVTFAANINTAGAIQTTAPDGKVLRSHVLGLAYTDAATGESVLIAGLKDSIGEVIGNQVIYRDAFDGPFKADLRYTYTKAGFEQDVIFRESPESPEKHGIDPAMARLEVWTEFLSPPTPVKTVSLLKVETNDLVRSVMVDPDMTDELLDFGAMRIGTGTAFSLENASSPLDKPAVPVGKDWLRLEGRDFLIEKIDFEDAQPLLRELPAARVNGVKQAALPAKRRIELLASLKGPKMDQDRAQAVSKPMRTASVAGPERGFVLDYLVDLTGNPANMVFKSDTTYYVSGVVGLTGTTTIEGGTVVKYASGTTAYLNVQGPLICQTEAYRPAFFTAKDDNSVGEIISGSTGVPSGYYGQYSLRIFSSAQPYVLRHLRIRHGYYGIYRFGGTASTPTTIEHSQFQNCYRAITATSSALFMRNLLVYRCESGVFSSTTLAAVGENITFHRLGALQSSPSLPALKLTNSLVISCTNYLNYTANSTVVNVLNDAGIFQASASALHYLAAGSSYRLMGSANINSNLLQDLKRTTTYPPEILSGTISQDRVLSPLVVRNSATAPDLGYAYDVIDYLAQNLTVQRTAAPAVTMTLKNGVVVGVNPLSGQTGIQFGNYSDLISVGQPGNLNRIIPMQMVQENGTSSAAWPGSFRVLHGAGLGNYPNASFRFTDISVPSGPYQLMAYWNGGFIKLAFQDSQVRGGTLYLGSDSPSQSIGLTNTYWERVSYWHHPYAAAAFHARNNLFKGGTLYMDMNPVGAPVWTFYDNLFDGTVISQVGGPAVENNFNAYVHTAQNTNRLSPAVAGSSNRDVILAASPVYEAGPFGNYYLQGAPTNLVDKGSCIASEAGLYHYTTATVLLTSEGTTVVDIGLHYVAATAGNVLMDTDADGFVDYQEDANGNGIRDNAETDFANADTDSDGLSDYQEIVALQGLVNPLLFDTDGDGLSDADEDTDRDLLSNIAELNTYITDPVDPHSLIREISPTPENYPLILAAGQNGGLQTDSHSLMAAQAGELGYVADLVQGSFQNGLIHFTLATSGSVPPNATFDIYVSDNVANTAHNRFHYKGTPGLRDYDVPVPTGPNGQFSAGSANDTDGDGLTDGFEVLVSRTSPNNPEPDSDGDGLPDAYEIAVTGTNPNSQDSDSDGILDGHMDTDYDGRNDRQEWVEDGTDPLNSASVKQVRLGYWRFNNTSWLGEAGQQPLSVLGSLSNPSSWSGKALGLNSSSPANLKYRDVESGGLANINCRQGTIRFWFKPDWLENVGPGGVGRLVEMGNLSNPAEGWWGLSVTPPNPMFAGIKFETRSPGGVVTEHFSTPIQWISDGWHRFTLTYGPSGVAVDVREIRVDQGAVNAQQFSFSGPGITGYPNGSERALHGFSIGSNRTGGEQAKGQFEELETFNYALSSEEIDSSYASIGQGASSMRVGVVASYVQVSDVTFNFLHGPSAEFAILVDNNNFASANWLPYLPSATVNIGNVEGPHDVWFGFRDIAENVTWWKSRVYLDTTPPTLTITTSSGATDRPSIQVMGNANEPLAGVTFDVVNADGIVVDQKGYVLGNVYNPVGGQFIRTDIQCFDVALAVGNNTVTIRATDLAGNTGVAVRSFDFGTANDTTPPSISVAWPPNNTLVSGDTFTLTGTLDDGTASVKITGLASEAISGMVERNGRFTFSGLPLAGGSHNFTITATDAAGNSSQSSRMVQKSSLNLQMTPVSPIAAAGKRATITGVVGSGVSSVTVNGVVAPVNNGEWTASDVPATVNGQKGILIVAVDPTTQQPVQTYSSLEKAPIVRISRYFEDSGFSAGSGVISYNRDVLWSKLEGGSSIEVDHFDNEVGGPVDRTRTFQWLAEEEGPPEMTTVPVQSPSDWGLPWNDGLETKVPLWFGDVSKDYVESGQGQHEHHFAATELEVQVGEEESPNSDIALLVTASAKEFEIIGFAQNQFEGTIPIPGESILLNGQPMQPHPEDPNKGIGITTVPSGKATKLDIRALPQAVNQYSFKVESLIELPIAISADLTRDGALSSERTDLSSSARPWRFWINDDRDNGDVGDSETAIPGQTLSANCSDSQVNGRMDLIDFFPVHLRLKETLEQLPPSDGYEYRLSHADGAVNFVYTDLRRADAFDYLTNPDQFKYGSTLNLRASLADTVTVTSGSGVLLSANFLERVIADGEKGVLLVEGRVVSSKPLMLEVWREGKKLVGIPFYIRLEGVEEMYRWVNLRQAFTVAGETVPVIDRASDTSQPVNFPDAESNGKQFIYLHGFNVPEQKSRGEISEAFKRFWQSGSRAMFTGVSWYGSQGTTTLLGASLDYYSNVRNAFLTAPHLKNAVATLPGARKFITAHSLGNMVVSSAIVDHSMSVEKYFALEAAVPMEAYDGSIEQLNMVNPDTFSTFEGWINYDRRLWASDWHKLFSLANGFVNDGRYLLTWRDRFGVIPNMYNFHSTGEEVLRNSQGVLPSPGAEYSWVSGEMLKGKGLADVLALFGLLDSHPQAGWAINHDWDVLPDGAPPGGLKYPRTHTQATPSDLTDAALRIKPFFRYFRDNRLIDPAQGSSAAAEPQVRAEVLGTGVPALSHATGANSVDVFHPLNSPDRNFNLNSTEFQTGWPTSRLQDPARLSRWLHSDLKDVAYPFNHKMHDKIIELGGLKNDN